MNRSNRADQMAPTKRFGVGLQPMRQAYMGIKFREQDECREHDRAALYGNPSGNGSMYPGASANWQRDYDICKSIDRRGMRGGMTMRPTDALTNMPRQTVRDGDL